MKYRQSMKDFYRWPSPLTLVSIGGQEDFSIGSNKIQT